MNVHNFLAFDLGADSGRAVFGRIENNKLTLEEVGRFPNKMITVHGHLHWNIFHLFEEMKRCLKFCASEIDESPESLALNTWGVDYALLGSDGSMLGLPYVYRDKRIEGAMDEFIKMVPREQIYEWTGIQFLPLNTLYQLFAAKRADPSLSSIVCDLLFMPDLFNYLLTEQKKTEFTIATTSQLFNPVTNAWEDRLFEALGLSKSIMQEVIPTGTILGNLSKDIGREVGLKELPVIAVASHDTGSAVAAVPSEGKNWVYISSGTWSLMGIESQIPIISKKTLNLNFTNEGGVQESFRILKNITGLWLLQACRRSWARERNYTYPELIDAAKSAAPFQFLLDPDRKEFLNPQDMPEAIRQACMKTGEYIPETPADFTRGILESLAFKYRYVLQQIKQISSHPVDKIHIIGGGAQNPLLCQFTADATGIPVIAGPIEATAIGNIMVQALTLGYVSSMAEMRDVIRKSFQTQSYEPQNTQNWDAQYERFLNLLKI